jgi:hypothetical protein
MRLDEPLCIEFEFDGDIKRLIQNPDLIKASRAGLEIPVSFINRNGDEAILVFIGHLAIPVDLSSYFKYHSNGETSWISLKIK